MDDHDCYKLETAKGVHDGNRIVRRAMILRISEPTVMVSKCASGFWREAGQDQVFLMKVNVFVYTGISFAETLDVHQLPQPTVTRTLWTL